MDQYWTSFFVTCCAQGLLAASVAFSWGRAGVFSLGPALYFGAGAYGVALAGEHGVPRIIGIAGGVAAAVLISGGTSLLSLRRPGGVLRYAASTMVLAIIAQRIAVRAYDTTGGSNGILIDGSLSLMTVSLSVAFIGALLLSLVVVDRHLRPLLLTLRDAPEELIRLGRDVGLIRILIVIPCSGIAALAGAIYAPASGIVAPDVFSVTTSMQCLAWVVIGARRPLPAFVAAVALQTVELLLGSTFSDGYLLLVAALLLAAAVLQAEDLRFWRLGRKIS